jgi:hypothetical protein
MSLTECDVLQAQLHLEGGVEQPRELLAEQAELLEGHASELVRPQVLNGLPV